MMFPIFKKITGGLLIFVICCGAVLAYAAHSAAQSNHTLQHKIQGNWVLVSIYNEWPDGRRLEQFGSHPRGSMMLAPDGRFSMFFMKANLPKFAAQNRLSGTDEENRAVVQGCIAYFGKYIASNEKDDVLTLVIEGCTFPNWDGKHQKRLVSFNGNLLKVTNPASGIGGASYIVWKRAN